MLLGLFGAVPVIWLMIRRRRKEKEAPMRGIAEAMGAPLPYKGPKWNLGKSDRWL
jgi:hypothetical protein